MSEQKATITIEIEDDGSGEIKTIVTIGGELNLRGASFAIANLKKSVIKAFEAPEILVDAAVESAKMLTEQKQPTRECAIDKLYELLERLHAQKEAGKDGNEA